LLGLFVSFDSGQNLPPVLQCSIKEIAQEYSLPPPGFLSSVSLLVHHADAR